MSTSGKVLAICVNWNGEGVLADTVDSLLGSRYQPLEIAVVDNASTDNSLSGLPDSIEVTVLDVNRGYGGALNAIIADRLNRETPDYFLLLNNDVLLHEDTLSQLVHFARDKGTAIFGPRIVRFEDTERLEAAWGYVTWSHVLGHFYGKNAVKSLARWQEIRKVELLLGSALLVHHKVFQSAGLFDESFFMYHEEVDFLYRVRRCGFPIYYCPIAEVLHHGGYATRSEPLKKIFWVRRNAIRFLRKHDASRVQWGYFWITLMGSLIYNLLTLRWTRFATTCSAVKEGFLGNNQSQSLERKVER